MAPKKTSVKPFKQENQRTNKKPRKTRITYEQHQQTITTEQQVPILIKLYRPFRGYIVKPFE